MDDQQQCLEPLLQITGSINIWLSALLSTRALSICFRFQKAQSYELKMFLNILQRGPTPPQRSYELNQLRIVHTTSMQKSLKTTMNPLWTTSSYLTTQIRNLAKSVEIPTISWNLYSSFTNSEHSKIWILETSYKEILILSIIRISTIKRECWLQQLSKNVQPPIKYHKDQ